MTKQTRNDLKQEFKDGERPSGKDFADLIESFLNITDDGLSVDSDSNVLLSAGMRLGNTDSDLAGALRFRDNKVQFHDGTTWVDIASGSGGAFQPVGASTAVAYAAGNVGIGAFATPPTYRLEVELGANTGEAQRARFGNAVCSNGAGASDDFACFSHRNHSSNSAFALRQSPEGNVHINAPSGQTVSIRQNGNQVRLGVTATGRVVVGSENDLGGAGAAALQVAGEAFKSSGTSAWTIPSDVRLKEDIRDLELGLQQLVQVRPVRFRYNGKAGTMPGGEGVGIVGQEMEKIFPDMVQHVENPNPGELEGDDLLVYNASALTYVLVNAVKELAAKVQKLEAALAETHNDPHAPVPDTA